MWEINGTLTKDEELVKKHFGLKYLPMVKSLTDSDAYKFSMGQCYHHQFGQLEAEWNFKSRNTGKGKALPEKYTEEDRKEISNQIQAYCALRFDPEELEYLQTRCIWIKPDYIEHLKDWRPHFNQFTIWEDEDTGLGIRFKGVQERVEYYEIPVLAITDEVYYRNHFDYEKLLREYKEKTLEKIERMKNEDLHFGTWSEFGARRRLSFEAQDWLINLLAETKKQSPKAFEGFIGTSNVMLAKKYGLAPIGTCAHEFIECVGQGDPSKNPAYSNKFAMDAWVKEYGILNGIWLTDTIGDELCRRDMKLTFSTLFGGVRNDSGDPFKWADNWVEHYKKYKIDPKTKTLLFSNNINSLEIWDKLCRYTETRAKAAFGIGTFWSGPQTITPLQNVAKVVKVNGMDVAKLSDDTGKGMCLNPDYVEYLKRSIDWRLKSDL